MICWVAERAQAARNVAGVIVATDDQRIVDAVENAGFKAVLTNRDHASGTDRVAEVAATLDAEIVVNVQGDEPLISPETIERAIEVLTGREGFKDSTNYRQAGGTSEKNSDAGAPHEPDVGIVTTWEPIASAEEVLNPDVVKIVVDSTGRALYFSRSPVPFPRDAVRRHGTIEDALIMEPRLLDQFRKHTGLYVYRREVLLELSKWPQSELERIESLEQLRALEHGVKIKAIEAATPSVGVDTEEDLDRVKRIVSSSEFRVSS